MSHLIQSAEPFHRQWSIAWTIWIVRTEFSFIIIIEFWELMSSTNNKCIFVVNRWTFTAATCGACLFYYYHMEKIYILIKLSDTQNRKGIIIKKKSYTRDETKVKKIKMNKSHNYRQHKNKGFLYVNNLLKFFCIHSTKSEK